MWKQEEGKSCLKVIVRNIGTAVGLWMIFHLIIGETPLVLLYDFRSGFRYHMAYPFCVAVIVILLAIKERAGLQLKWKIRIGASRFVQVPPERGSKYYGLFMAVCTIACLALVGVWAVFGNPSSKDEAWQGDLLIGHSFSGIDGTTYTGSKEAFLEGYANGYRTFEVDIIFTSDEELVLAHGWEQSAEASGRGEWKETPPTMGEFLETPIGDNGYTPLALSDLFRLMQAYPDIWIITDTKYTDSEQVERQFSRMIETARENACMDVLDRVVVQLYREQMYEPIQRIYPFQSYIFTMYQRWWGENWGEFSAICRWCVSHGVHAVTMKGDFSYEKAWRIAAAYGLDVYVHTINEVSEAARFLESGVRGVYTDFIKENELEAD